MTQPVAALDPGVRVIERFETMKVPIGLLAASAALVGVASCAPTRPDYLGVAMVSISLDCSDGYMVYNRTETKTILVTPYFASEAYHRLCGANAPPLNARARKAAEKHLGPSCQVLSEAEPWPLNFEFAYQCGVTAVESGPPKPR